MKKILLLLFFFLSITTYAQIPPGIFYTYQLCDDAVNDGFATFDLVSTDPIAILGLDPAIHTVTFHLSYADAIDNSNEISNPSAYINTIPNTQNIAVRIVNTATNEVHASGMDLIVNPLPTVNPASMTFCDPNELALYDLSQANSQITAGAVGSTVTYYHSLADAQLGTNPMSEGYAPTINPGTEILFARVTNSTECFATTTLTLNTQNCPDPCQAPSALTASMITLTSATLSWTGSPNSTAWEVFLAPSGSLPVIPSPVGSIIVQTNPFLITGLSPNTCYTVYIRTICNVPVVGTRSMWSGAMHFCTYDCTNSGECPENLTLSAFLDSNNNDVKDSGEENFNIGNFVYDLNDSGAPAYGYANSGLFYIFDSNPANSYDISFAVNPNYASYFSSATSYSNITLPTGSGMNTYYFPVTQLQSLNDLEIHLIPNNGNPRPGFTYSNYITYKNNGAQTIASGTISFTKSPIVSISNIYQAGTNITPTGFDYTFSNLAPNESRTFYLDMLVPTIPTVTLGDIVTNTVTIEPLSGDNIPANNTASLSQAIVGSYDPNEKSESHGGKIGLDTFTANDYLYYTILFENTGSAAAEFIRVEDILDAGLDESTFEMIKASHMVNTQRSGNQLTWHFYNINLLPTVTDPTNSHGYVYFRIKPKTGYAVGDIIPNAASIYFDYNPAIVTDAFNTEFFDTLGNPSFDKNDFLLYPNPANTTVQIVNKSNELIEKVSFYDVAGKLVKQITNAASSQSNIDVSVLAKGIYFVEIITESHPKQIRKLIIQ